MYSDSSWKNTFASTDISIKEAIRVLDEGAMQIVLIVDEKERLQGTLTDGDIRRSLLGGLTLDDSIESLIQKESFVVPPDMEREMVLQIMRANRIHQLPVVDGDRRVVGLHTWDRLSETHKHDNAMVIMAGGKGTRLRPHTEKCPKPLLPIAGKPMMEHIIEQARDEGFKEFIVSTHYLSHMIEEHFGDGSDWQVNIEYVKEENPLGTAGALAYLKGKLEEPFVVTNGDVLTDIHYGELLDFHLRHQADATMAVRLHEWQHPFGVVQIDGIDITGFEEKPIARTHINAGIYVLNPSALNQLTPDERCDMPTLFERLKNTACRTIAYPMHEPWLDVGRPDDLHKARQEKTDSIA
jgi:dTDP-glucose pyrophosphorylase